MVAKSKTVEPLKWLKYYAVFAIDGFSHPLLMLWSLHVDRLGRFSGPLQNGDDIPTTDDIMIISYRFDYNISVMILQNPAMSPCEALTSSNVRMGAINIALWARVYYVIVCNLQVFSHGH